MFSQIFHFPHYLLILNSIIIDENFGMENPGLSPPNRFVFFSLSLREIILYIYTSWSVIISMCLAGGMPGVSITTMAGIRSVLRWYLWIWQWRSDDENWFPSSISHFIKLVSGERFYGEVKLLEARNHCSRNSSVAGNFERSFSTLKIQQHCERIRDTLKLCSLNNALV